MTDFGIPAPPVSDDRWAAAGRSPVAAAIIALLGIGAVYFTAQLLFTVVGVLMGVHGVAGLESLRDTLMNGGADYAPLVASLRWAVMLSQYLALLLPTVLLARAWHGRHVARYVRLRPAPAAEVALAMLGTLLILPIGTTVTNALRSGAPQSSDVERLTEQLFTAHSPAEFAFLVLVVAVTPAICEEFFFRGYVQRTFERAIGARSVLLVGVIFGLFHMQPAGLLTLTMIGIWLGFVYNRSRAMLPNMAAHFTNNFLALWVAYKAPVVFGIDTSDDMNIPLAWGLIALPLFVAVAWGYYGLTERRRARATAQQFESSQSGLAR